MSNPIVYHERLNFIRRGSALVVSLLIVVALAYAGWSGASWRDAQLESLQTYEAEELETLAEYRAGLVDIESGAVEPGPYDANPMSVSLPAVLLPASLADFAVGHSDLHPSSALISPWRHLASTFGRYQFDNPTTLASSAFDVALVIVMLMPILMIAVSFDVLASERQSGLLAMLLAAPASLSRIVWTRLAVRNGLLWAVAIAMMLALALINGEGGDRLARLGVWLAVCLLYGFFWFVLIALCVATFRSAVATAASLVGLWLLFTLAVPATLSTAAEALYPTPSRLALLSEIRQAQGETNRRLSELTEGYLMDHPDLSVGSEELPSFFRAAYLSNEAARESAWPIMEAYQSARDGREQATRWAQFLSPSVVTQRLLMQAAGGDLERQHRFQAQVIEELAELAALLGPAVVSRNRISVAEFDQIQPFTFEDSSMQEIVHRAAVPSLFLLLLSLGIGLVAQRRLQSAGTLAAS